MDKQIYAVKWKIEGHLYKSNRLKADNKKPVFFFCPPKESDFHWTLLQEGRENTQMGGQSTSHSL